MLVNVPSFALISRSRSLYGMYVEFKNQEVTQQQLHTTGKNGGEKYDLVIYC